MTAVTIAGYLGSLYTVEVSLLPSGLAQVVFVLRFAFGPVRSAAARWSPLLEASSRRSGRDITWRHEGSLSWCGPVAYGGELHRELVRDCPVALRSLVRAWDPIASTWRPVDPPAVLRARPLDEDDDDNAETVDL